MNVFMVNRMCAGYAYVLLSQLRRCALKREFLYPSSYMPQCPITARSSFMCSFDALRHIIQSRWLEDNMLQLVQRWVTQSTT